MARRFTLQIIMDLASKIGANPGKAISRSNVQGPRTLRALLKLGYPAAKLKWYRGGIQAWESVGLTTVRNE
jgi:rhodanese-related sulfurtransferase